MRHRTIDVPASVTRPSYRWAWLRLGLGTAQIIGATVSLVLLLSLGQNWVTWSVVAMTGLLTSVSLLLFRSESPVRGKR